MKTKIIIGVILVSALVWAGVYFVASIYDFNLRFGAGEGGDIVPVKEKTIEQIIAEKPELELKTTKDKILDSKDTTATVDGTSTAVKSYGYISEIKQPAQELEYKGDKLTEDISKRTPNSEFYNTGKKENGKEVMTAKIYSGSAYYKEGEDWKVVEYATTTKDAFEKQMEATVVERVISFFTGKPIYAACGTSGDPCYAGSGDGSIEVNAGAITWAQVWATVTGTLAQTNRADMGEDGYGHAPYLFYSATGNVYVAHTFVPIDTSALPDSGITITAAVLYRYIDAIGNDTNGIYDYTACVPSLVTSNTALANADVNLLATSTLWGTSPQWSSESAGTWEQTTLNAAGIAGISQTGYTKLALITGWEYVAYTYSPGSTKYNYLDVRSSEYTGTASDPYLSITFTTGGGGAVAPSPVVSPIINFD